MGCHALMESLRFSCDWLVLLVCVLCSPSVGRLPHSLPLPYSMFQGVLSDAVLDTYMPR